MGCIDLGECLRAVVFPGTIRRCFQGEGWAVLHLGRQVHGTEKIRWGERANLVIWSRSWAWRAAGRIHV